MSPEPKHHLLVDVFNLAYRYMHAMAPLSSTRAGIHTHVIFGWTKFLLDWQSRLSRFVPKDAEIILFFDDDQDVPGGLTNTIDGYKGNREPRPPMLTEQLPWLKILASLLGFKYVAASGVEADHLLGGFTLANRGKFPISILTSDKDMLQLIDDDLKISIIKPENGGTYKLMNRQAVFERWGVYPELIPDFLLMFGDKSDNIPGVPGIGEKTAPLLLARFGSLDKIVEAVGTGELKPKINESINACRDQIRICRELVLFRDMPVKIRQGKFDLPRVIELCRHFEMVSIIGKLAEKYE